MTRPTPAAAWLVLPVGMEDAAAALGISKRTLVDVMRNWPHLCERRGRNRDFYPEHIDGLRKEMNRCAFNSDPLKVGGMSPGPVLMAHASDALSRLAILSKQRKRARS